MHVAGIILCGGRSARMGAPKALLPFGPETLLQRMVRLLSQVTSPVIVVAAPGQSLPPLEGDACVVYDRQEGRGPLEGMLAGLSAVREESLAAYVTSCDVPLLVPSIVSLLAESLADYDAAVPHVEGFLHPLSAVYRVSVIPAIESLLGNDQRRATALLDVVPTRLVAADELRAVDPTLATLQNLNTPDDYLAALAVAGFKAPDQILQRLATCAGKQPDARVV